MVAGVAASAGVRRRPVRRVAAGSRIREWSGIFTDQAFEQIRKCGKLARRGRLG
jgi:hypothetical protein